jgi:hypothetical protein
MHHADYSRDWWEAVVELLEKAEYHYESKSKDGADIIKAYESSYNEKYEECELGMQEAMSEEQKYWKRVNDYVALKALERKEAERIEMEEAERRRRKEAADAATAAAAAVPLPASPTKS